jgi:hypothetical protein
MAIIAPISIIYARINKLGKRMLLRRIAFKPYPAVEEMHNVQRLLKTQNPRISELNVDDLVDNCYIRKLDESGFFERIYSK